MRKPIKIYLAGPLTNGNISHNVNQAMLLTDVLLNKGFVPFCPHLLYFQHCAFWRSYQAWLDYDLEWLKVCDVVFRMEGESSGSDKEVLLAKSLNIPVFTSLYELEQTYAPPTT
jgi:nucleoside 2-deoxyribosyltransferase